MSRHAPEARTEQVERIDLMQSTVYAVRGQRTVLVDAGPAGHEARLLRRLDRAGIPREDIAAIVLTHCHPDHAGGAAELRRRLDVPIAVHAAEAKWAAAGRSHFYRPLRPFGHVLRRTMRPTFRAFIPDIVLEQDGELDQFGTSLRMLHTPGHTPGSITLVHGPTGDALVGDLLAGSVLRDNRPNWPFFAQDTAQIRRSVRTVLKANPRRLLFGHGRPASAQSVVLRFP